MKNLRIRHKDTGTLLAEGPLGWGITPFEGNLYIARKYLKTDRFRVNYVPGLCIYKFLYVWLDFHGKDGDAGAIAGPGHALVRHQYAGAVPHFGGQLPLSGP